MNWQNIRDDLYAHRYDIERKSGIVAVALGILGMLALAIWVYVDRNPSAGAAASAMISVAVVLGYGLAMHLPRPNLETRYRYKLWFKHDAAADLLVDWAFTGQTKIMNEVGSVTQIGFTRFEDFVLAKLKYKVETFA